MSMRRWSKGRQFRSCSIINTRGVSVVDTPSRQSVATVSKGGLLYITTSMLAKGGLDLLDGGAITPSRLGPNNIKYLQAHLGVCLAQPYSTLALLNRKYRQCPESYIFSTFSTRIFIKSMR